MKAGFAAVLGAAACLAGCTSARGVPAPPLFSAAVVSPRGEALLPPYIRHVVIVVQENRSPDNLFHGLPNADIATTGVDSTGATVPLVPLDLNAPCNLDHSHASFLLAFKHQADLEGEVGCLPLAAFSYVPRRQVQPYLDMAKQYAFADRMFQSNQGPSFPAHLFIVAGTSQIAPASGLLAAENPLTNAAVATGGCDSPAGSLVQLIDSAGDENHSAYPCFTGTKTIFDLLDERGVSWKYYIRRKGPGLWNAPDAIRHIRFGAEYARVVSPETTILRDVARGRLPEVSWVIPGLDNSDHPRLNNGSGPSWVASVVNAVGESPYWNTTAIVVTWDDWGGWYDHVTPLETTSYERGFRVPLLLISPYAKRAYVSHTTYEFGSILRFVEENWGLGTLGATDEGSASIVDMLNFARPPRRFRAIEAARPASYFLNRRLRPGDDDEPD